MRTTIAVLALCVSAAIAAEPTLPSTKQATVQPADVPGYLVISDPRSTRGYDALLIPLASIVYVTDRVAPKGTREERTLTLAVDLGGPTPATFIFDDSTATKPAEVLKALAEVRR